MVKKYVIFCIILGLLWGLVLSALGMWSVFEVVVKDNITVTGVDRNVGKAAFLVLLSTPFTLAGAVIIRTCWEFLALARRGRAIRESKVYQRTRIIFNPSSKFWEKLLPLTVPLLGILPVIALTDEISR